MLLKTTQHYEFANETKRSILPDGTFCVISAESFCEL